MPFTPFHLAYALLLKWRFKKLDGPTLIIASFIPDIENYILAFMGVYPNRLITHSLIGVFTIDLFLTILLVYFISNINLKRIGLPNLKPFKLSSNLIFSGILGALLHVLIDTSHHKYNPIFWQIGPTYITGPLVIWFGQFQAHLIIHLISLLLLVYILRIIFNKNGEQLSIIYKNPMKATTVLMKLIID